MKTTTVHKGQSIKELVDSRLRGYHYKRLPKDASDYLKNRPSLQQIASSVLERHADKLPEAAFDLRNKQMAKAEQLHQAIIRNEIQSQSPQSRQVQTPTMLKKLNPSQVSRDKAMRDVAQAQTHVVKEHMAKEMHKALDQSARQFTRVPKSIAMFGS
ncbi:MAG: hypothetical protein O3C63_07275 [Cyanobacteria bacterium]|nr:hypothetical protein [Cyanobacteriota bacterium]MDA1020960.1 hypothetical protein [Cyanobacteriota bacterium]